MNNAAILTVVDYLRGLSDEKFCRNRHFNHRYHAYDKTGPAYPKKFFEQNGLAVGATGAVLVVFGYRDAWSQAIAMGVKDQLSLTDEEYRDLFYSPIFCGVPVRPSRIQYINVLEHFAKTGKVDWSKRDVAIKAAAPATAPTVVTRPAHAGDECEVLVKATFVRYSNADKSLGVFTDLTGRQFRAPLESATVTKSRVIAVGDKVNGDGYVAGFVLHLTPDNYALVKWAGITTPHVHATAKLTVVAG